VRLHCGLLWRFERIPRQLYGLSMLVVYTFSQCHLESMEFTAGLGAKDVRLTFIPGDDGGNREKGGKKYKRSGNNHGENDAFTRCLKRGDQLILLYRLYMLSLP